MKCLVVSFFLICFFSLTCLSGCLQVPCLLLTAYSSGVKLELRLKLGALILSHTLTLSAFLSLQETQGAAAPCPSLQPSVHVCDPVAPQLSGAHQEPTVAMVPTMATVPAPASALPSRRLAPAQPQGTATVRGWGSCPSGCVGLQVPHGPRGVPSTTPAVGQALLTALFTCRFRHGSSQLLWADQEALLGLGRLAAPTRAQELLSFAACYSHGDAAEASCTFLPSMSMSPFVLQQPSQGLRARLCARGGKGTLSLGLAPKLEGSPGAGTCLVERCLSTVPLAPSFGVFLLPEQTLPLFLLHSFQS